jgi:NAD(P)H-dependent flavin oxidoreductase YrpB (nitropropane dioxygenase family)
VKDNDRYCPIELERARWLAIARPRRTGVEVHMESGGTLSRRRLLALLGLGVASRIGDVTVARAQTTDQQAASDSLSDDLRAHASLDTRLTREYGVRYPFVSAGMGFVSYPPLVTAVSNAGGIGVLGNAIEPPPSTQQLIRTIAAGTSGLFGVDFIHDDTAFGPATTDAHVDVCIAEGVRLVVFHINVPPRIWVDRLHAAGCRVWTQVGSVDQAIDAAQVGVDAVIAQGRQAGGHNKSVTRTIPLLRQVVRAVQPVMVLASGGIASGADVVHALENGAEGVWVGTRMVASVEAYAHDEYKRRLLAAEGRATDVTTAFGPEYRGVPYRVLRTDLVKRVAGHEDQIPPPQPSDPPIGETVLFPFTLRVPYTMPQFSAVVPTPDTSGDFDLMGFPAGEDSVRQLKSIKPAAAIISEMMSEARDILMDRL